MKKIKLGLTCVSISLLLISCGDGSPSKKVAKEYYNNVEERVNKCTEAYQNFDLSIPLEESGSQSEVNAAYNDMIKTFDEEKKKLQELETLKGGEEHQAASQKLKDAALKLIDIYTEGGKNELAQMKKFANEGKSALSDEIMDISIPFSEKAEAANESFADELQKFEIKYAIMLY